MKDWCLRHPWMTFFLLYDVTMSIVKIAAVKMGAEAAVKPPVVINADDDPELETEDSEE